MSQNKPLLLDQPFENWHFEGLPSYRLEQIREWIFEKGTLDFENMSNLPLALRKEMENEWINVESRLSNTGVICKKIDITVVVNKKNQGAGKSTIKLIQKIKKDGFQYLLKVDGDDQFKASLLN